MEPISGVQTSTAAFPLSPERIKEAAEAEHTSAGASRPLRPTRDEYIPEEKQEPSGRYWMGKAEDGSPQIFFDAPVQASSGASEPADSGNSPDKDASAKAEDAGKKKAPAKGDEICRGSTDAVDREIENLKKKQEELQRQIASETDETKRQTLERKLSQVEQELRQKDNDAYRRQHTVFS